MLVHLVKKRVASGKEMVWLVRDTSAELKAWGHPGGDISNQLILECDNEPSIMAVRDALARFHGGRIIPEGPPKGESQSNGAAEEAGKTVREYVRVRKEQIEDKAGMKLHPGDVVVQWMI